jgi:hypothetical protein
MTLNGSLVNIDASHYAGSAFSSNVDPRTVNVNVMPEPASNIQAAASYIPCKTGGGRKKKSYINRHKINKISRMYKMKGNKKSAKRIKSRLRSKYSAHSRSRYATRKRSSSRKRGRSLKQKGGYAQYQNNMPMTQTYSTGGPLSPSLSSLATPPPYQVLSNCTNCIDNFEKYDNVGFPSRGWH